MKKLIGIVTLILLLTLAGCGSNNGEAGNTESEQTTCDRHTDYDINNLCDKCGLSVLVYVDFYAINDMHGKFTDSVNQPGVDELTTYLKRAELRDDHMIILSAGDMWQGSAESNLTKGQIITDWMNEVGFAGMAVGNHEFDWGEEYVESNANMAEFPLLAINIYDRDTNERVEYCDASVVVEAGELKIGIIGAIGDCYSSISAERTTGVYFKVGKELTQLVKEESTRLREEEGVDFVVYVLHDGYGNSQSSESVSNSAIASYYDVSLSDGYVDLVFEGHTHQSYILKDSYGVYHIQNGGENREGISHIEVGINSVNGNVRMGKPRHVDSSTYDTMDSDPIVEDLLEKYKEELAPAYEKLGYNSAKRSSNALKRMVSQLYFEAGYERWGEEYDIVLGGGFISVRSPYNLETGDVYYSDLQMLLPFDNELVLCSIKGSVLLRQFITTDNDNYFVTYGEYGKSVKNNIDPNGSYYIVTDTYSLQYGPNQLTEIERYDSGVYARDLMAEYIKNGGYQ